MLDHLSHVLPVLLSDVDEHAHINFLAIPVAAIASFVLGGLWYAPFLFGKPWAARAWAHTGGKPTGGMAKAMIVHFFSDLAMAVGLTVLIASALTDRLPFDSEVASGAATGALVWLAFLGPLIASFCAYNGRGIVLWLIDSGYRLGSLAVMGAILGGWHG
ncbi:MAG: DUF1761 domain-containing protein [Planctomycetes bacterium]|nr:DUF1761 domain-containing protein [Planctomycetota bacterium]